jgi:hypothetical protein
MNNRKVEGYVVVLMVLVQGLWVNSPEYQTPSFNDAWSWGVQNYPIMTGNCKAVTEWGIVGEERVWTRKDLENLSVLN